MSKGVSPFSSEQPGLPPEIRKAMQKHQPDLEGSDEFPAALHLSYPRVKADSSFTMEAFRKGLAAWKSAREAPPESIAISGATDYEDLLERFQLTKLLPYRRTPRIWKEGQPTEVLLKEIVERIETDDCDVAYELLIGNTLEPNSPALLGDFEAAPNKWLAHGWIPINRVTVLYGDSGTGTTRLALQLACAVAAGKKHWIDGRDRITLETNIGRIAGQSDVVFASWDRPPPELRRLADEGDPGLFEKELPLHVLHLNKPMNCENEFSQTGHDIRKYCALHRPKLLIIDSLDEACKASETYYSSWTEEMRNTVRSFVQVLDRWAQAWRCTIILIAHNPPDHKNNYLNCALQCARSSLQIIAKDDGERSLRLHKSPFTPKQFGRTIALDRYPFMEAVGKAKDVPIGDLGLECVPEQAEHGTAWDDPAKNEPIGDLGLECVPEQAEHGTAWDDPAKNEWSSAKWFTLAFGIVVLIAAVFAWRFFKSDPATPSLLPGIEPAAEVIPFPFGPAPAPAEPDPAEDVVPDLLP